jgi:hypothetical protein
MLYVIFYTCTTFRGMCKLGSVINSFMHAIFIPPFVLFCQFYCVSLFECYELSNKCHYVCVHKRENGDDLGRP